MTKDKSGGVHWEWCAEHEGEIRIFSNDRGRVQINTVPSNGEKPKGDKNVYS